MRISTRSLFSTLWIFLILNYFYCDLLSLMDANNLSNLLKGKIDGISVNSTFLIISAVLMEIPILMVLLSRLLKPKLNRWANIVAGIIMTLVMVTSLLVGTVTWYYAFFATIEITTTLTIVWRAIIWKTETITNRQEI